MRNLLLILLLTLGACAPLAEHLEEPTQLDVQADKILPATTPAERATRVCFVTAVVAEAWTYRLRFHGAAPEEMLMYRVAAMQMRPALVNLQFAAGGFWFETEMFYLLRTLLVSLGPQLRDRAEQLVADAATGALGNIFDTLLVAAGQTLLADAMLRDIKAQWGSGASWEVCVARLELNLSKLGVGGG